MFEAVELGNQVSKETWEAEVPALRTRLLEAQRQLRESPFGVLIIVGGVDGAGKSELVHRLNEWLDPRGVETHGFGEPSDEERERPRLWRFWRDLPAKGRVAVLFGSWYTRPIVWHTYGELSQAGLDRELHRIEAFERMLVADGTLVLKFWLHVSQKSQKRRLRALEADKRTRQLVTATDWKHHELYSDFTRISSRAIRLTDTAHAPWMLVEAEDDRYRDLTVAQKVCAALERRLEVAEPAKPSHLLVDIAGNDGGSILDAVDTDRKLDGKAYSRQLDRQQVKLARLSWRAWSKKVSTVLVFEGWDAAGKGGAIRRLTAAVDPRLYKVIPIAAPNDEERAHSYLWRFWRRLPRAGMMSIFDRSWYGRVLVERVEGFASADDWGRAYAEINDFEEQLVEHGVVVCKFWLHITPEEQLRRFKEREMIPYKAFKITPEDWRNRERWPEYQRAVDDMVARTSTVHAPWTLISANDKRWARVQVLRTVNERLAQARGMKKKR